ncbi:hypothetical protein ABIA00_003120 [Bradyrhizobium ottawaense]
MPNFPPMMASFTGYCFYDLEEAILNEGFDTRGDGYDVGVEDASAMLREKECVSAWNKDPVFGVIGIQSGPRDKGPQWLPSSHGSRGWDAGGGDDW